MADFISTLRGLPGMNTITDETMTGLVGMVVSDICGRHRWPYLTKVNQTVNWSANDAVQSFDGMVRIINIMYPDSGGDYYRLTELSDIEFQKWVEMNPDDTETRVWRDAGMEGNKFAFELFSVPTSAKTLKVDYVELPGNDSIDTLPGRFQGLVTLGVRALANPEVPFLLANYENAIKEAIAREQDLQGKRDKMGRDPVQSSRWGNAWNPS